jgi:ATP-dependent RNA helicase SUPV3L1/SUV3
MRFILSSSRLARTGYVPLSLSRCAFSTTICRARSKPRPAGPSKASQMATTRLEQLDGSVSTPAPTGHKKRETDKTVAVFRKLVLDQYRVLMHAEPWAVFTKDQYIALGVQSKLDLDREANLFRAAINKACDLAAEKNALSRQQNPLFWTLRHAFVTSELKGLSTEIKYAFQSFLMRTRFPNNILATHQKIADMRFPHEWFPATRAMQRTIHLHVGPTNSGKTYNALKALENAKSGVYAGPLRLLAHEVYTRFMAKGKLCALITGEEQRIPKGIDTYFKSCTVEMTPMNIPVDVAVIDEIQMIGDSERGWAWTQAFLGIQAKEVHLCGEERVVELIQSLCNTIGDECVVHRYQRLSGLETMDRSLGGRLENLEKGDAVVSFSRLGIHSLKRQIEEVTGNRCAVVYGSLPPETRAQQAALFNDPNNNYDYLVASDAIGMGLNLEIRRVVFEATSKRDNTGYRQMAVPELKQIGGRAGRYRTANQAIQGVGTDDAPPRPKPSGPGLVTALEDPDLAVIIEAFQTEPEPMKTAGLQPPVSAIERLSTYFPPNTPLSFIILRLRDIARLSPRFHLCHLKEMLEVAHLIQPYPMAIYDRCVFLNAPVALRDKGGAVVLQAFAKCVSRMDGGHLLDIREIPLEVLDDERDTGPEYLRKLESLHKSITLYLWLSYRFSGVFPSQNLAFHVKGLVEEKISNHLSGISISSESRRRRAEKIRQRVQARKEREEREGLLLEENAGAGDAI